MVVCLLVGALGAGRAAAAVSCPSSNPVVNENNCESSGSTGWQISNQDMNDDGPSGFAVQPSYDLGQAVQLKIGSYDENPVNINVYRMGYYGGTGGRLVFTANNVAVSNYANCETASSTTGEVDCDNWAVSATIPASALPASGVYIATLDDPKSGYENQILFVVRDDASTSPCLVKVPTATYQAYNEWGDRSLYNALSSGSDLANGEQRALAVSFERPLADVTSEPNYFLHDEYALVYWIEQQGYNCTYTDSTGIAEGLTKLTNHKVIVVGGHDEYWSAAEMSDFKTARADGVSIASFSANTSYWQVNYEDNYQTISEYKTIQDGSSGISDPNGASSTFRDPGAAAGAANAPPGGRAAINDPENSLWGVLYVGDNDSVSYPLVVPPSDSMGDYAGNQIWRNTGINPANGATLGTNLVGYEWDAVPNSASPLYAPMLSVEPSSVYQLSESPVNGNYEMLADDGYSYEPRGSTPPGQPADSEAVMYTASSGAIVFSAGTIQWAWGLGPYWIASPGSGETYFQKATNTEVSQIEQATYNVFSDMGLVPATPVSSLVLDGSTTTTGTTTTGTTGTTTTGTTTTGTTTTGTTGTGTTPTGSSSGGSLTTAYAKAVLSTSGLTNYWRMGDAAGSTTFSPAAGGISAALNGGVTLGSAGALPADSTKSSTFDGSTGSGSAALNLSADSTVTVEFWLNWKAYANNDALALEFTPNFNNNAGGFLVDPNASTGPDAAGDFGVAIGQGSSRNTIYFQRPSSGAWHQYTFVLNTTAAAGTEVTPYVDGQAVSFTQTAAGTGAGNFANSVLYWMSRDGNALFGAGSMQDLSIYNSALSASTILNHYQVGSAPAGTGTTTTGTTTTGTTTTGTTTTKTGTTTTGTGTTTTKTGTTTTGTGTSTTGTTTTGTTTTGSSAGGSQTTAYAKAVLSTAGLSNYWRMGDVAGATSFSPASGSVTAALTGGVTLGGAGALPADSTTSASFNGSTGAGSAALNLSAASTVTVEFWLNWKAYANNDALALEFTPNFNNNAGGFLVDPNASTGPDAAGDFGVAIGQGSSRNTIYFQRPSSGAWHQYTFVLNTTAAGASEITPYVDGQPVSFTQTASGTGAGNFANSVLYWMSRDGSALFGTGSMQDLAVYSQALSSATILNHYQVGAAPASGTPTGTTTTGSTPTTGTGTTTTGTGTTKSTTTTATTPTTTTTAKSPTTNTTGTTTTKSTTTTATTPTTTTQTTTTKSTTTTATTPTTTTQTTTTKSTTTTATTPTTTTSGGTGSSPASGQSGSTTTAYAKAVLSTTGLNNYWRMGDAAGATTLAPAAGSVSATLTGGVTLGGTGAMPADPNTSASFDGSTGSGSAALNLSADSTVTVEFWLNWKTYSTNDALALEFTPNFNSNPGGFLVDPNAGNGPDAAGDFGVAIGEGSSRNTIYFQRPSAGAWHEYTFVLNTTASAATEVTPYVDGQPVSFTQTASGTGAGNFASSVLYWMSRDGNSLFGAGSMQDLAIYNSALSASTILSHYQTGEASK